LAGSIGARERPAEHAARDNYRGDVAALGILTEALDEPGTDVAHSLQQLALAVAAAIPTYHGLSVVVPHSDPPFTVTTLADAVKAGDIRTSLQVLLPTMGADHDAATVAVILYAAAPGTFVDLAADLAWLTGRPTSEVTLDGHLTVPARPEPPLSYRRHQISTRPSACSSTAVTPPTSPLAT
jgi:hypothetical protein